MSTVYINNTGSVQTGPSGSWGVGSDTNSFAQAQSVATPFNSIKKFIDDPSRTAGDIAVLFGTVAVPTIYNENDMVSTKAIELRAEVDNAVTLRGDSSGIRVIYAQGSNATLQGIIVDAEEKEWAVYGSTGGAIEIIGGKLINWTRQGVLANAALVLRGNLEISTTTASTNADIAGYRANCSADNESVFIGSGVAVDITHTAATGTVRGGYVKKVSNTVLNMAVVVESGHTIDITTTGAGAIIQHLLIGGFSGQHVDSTTVGALVTSSTAPATVTNVTGLLVKFQEPDTVDKVHVVGATSTHTGSTPTGGLAMVIGNDTNVFARGGVVITDFLCEQNVLENFSHGLMLGGLADCVAERNTITNCNLSQVVKNSLRCKFNANKVINPRTSHARFKSSTDCLIDNTTVYIDADISGTADALAVYKNDGQFASSGNRTTNNSIYVAAGARVYRVIAGDADSVGEWTAANNNYYAADGWLTAATQPFATINAVNYTFAEYQAAFEDSATEVDPQLANPPSDFTPSVPDGGLLGSATGYSDYNNVLYPDPPPWGAFVSAPTPPTLTSQPDNQLTAIGASTTVDVKPHISGATSYVFSNLPTGAVDNGNGTATLTGASVDEYKLITVIATSSSGLTAEFGFTWWVGDGATSLSGAGGAGFIGWIQ